jgi:hypothetical protein
MAAQDSNGPEANSSATTPQNQTDPTGSGTTTSNLKVPLYGNAGQETGHLIGDREGWSLLPHVLLCFVCFIADILLRKGCTADWPVTCASCGSSWWQW